MVRTILAVTGILGASSWLLLDSTLKGTALLALAAVAVLMLRRDSAATRHLVWLLAIVALLAVPLLSAMLPHWQVLPGWARAAPEAVSEASHLPVIALPAIDPLDSPRHLRPVANLPPLDTPKPVVASSHEQPASIAPQVPPMVWSANITKSIPLAWGIGCSLLMLRLVAARWMLWNTERQATAIGLSASDPLASALAAAAAQLKLQQCVALLVHSDKTIPVVWGIFRPRLLLPGAAREWSSAQLHSVLLHELAHIKRRDVLTQLLTQFACALHWFNPLVWFAAWRLGVERERACDDLVLASGVRPSAYAGHLLDVVAQLSPAPWSHSCGLAMARKSSLESRLAAVLSGNLNRRGVPSVLAALALLVTVGIAVPIAMLRAAVDEPSAKDPTPPAAQIPATAAEAPKPAVTTMQPKHEYAQALFRKWRANARTDGKIPGALVGQLAQEIESFLKQHPQDEKTPKLAALLPRIDAAHDWPQADVIALLDDITAISSAPVSWVDLPLEFAEMHNLKSGKPLPAELKNVDWGAPAANGLRAAWLLEPRADRYALGSVLKARVLFHNGGKESVVFRTETWHQTDGHQARDAKDATINVSGTFYTGITPLATYRLAPGEYCEVLGHGIAIGAGAYEEEHSIGSVGAVIEAKEGDEVRLAHTVKTNEVTWSRPSDPKDPHELWKQHIAERVVREAPLPTAVADRAQLVRRVTLDVFGVAASAEEVATFVNDDAPDALAKLTARLQAKPRVEPWSGELATGETKFRVTAVDPKAAKMPKTANSPGRYVLNERVHLLVSQITTDSERTNKAVIAFLSADPKVASPHKPYELQLPNGTKTYGIVWERGAGTMWVMQQGLVRKCDFTDPAAVKETRFEPGKIEDLPEQLREPLRTVFQAADAPAQPNDPKKVNQGAKLEPGLEERLKWGETVNGLRAALAIRHASDKPKADDPPDLFIVLQNVAEKAIRITDVDVSAKTNLRKLYLRINDKLMWGLGTREPPLGEYVLQPREVAFLPIFDPHTKLEVQENPALVKHTIGSHIADDAIQDPKHNLFADMEIAQAPAGAWTGKLITAATTGAVAAGKSGPKDKDARALFQQWQNELRVNGKVPGGLIGRLGDKVLEFVRNNTGDAAGDPYAKKMAPLVSRFDASRDWTQEEVVKLLDDVATANTIPLQTTLEEAARNVLYQGTPLPKELVAAAWGEPQPNGLRLAWLLEPRGGEHRLGTPLRAEVLIHNSGQEPVVFRTRGWHQSGEHKAHDAKGNELPIESTYWTTRSNLNAYRLAPGQFVQLRAAGIGVGKNKDNEDWQGTRVGSWIDAKAGDEVTFVADPVPLHDWNEEPATANWWLEFITTRLKRELPLPADAAERIRLLDRAGRDLFGVKPTVAETAAFVGDKEASALDSLAKRLAKRPGIAVYSGSLASGPTKFRVLAVDPDAAKKPRTASNPGRYTLANLVRLEVSRRPDGERIVNEATVSFYSQDPKQAAPGEPFELKLPDGYNSWAAAWIRGETVLWVQAKEGIRSYDFTNPAQVKETKFTEPEELRKVPQAISDALRILLSPAPARG